MTRYLIYVLRWIVLAVPGTWVLMAVQQHFTSTLVAMVISQGLLGMLVYFVDKRILRG